jgi:hypothetical protein
VKSDVISERFHKSFNLHEGQVTPIPLLSFAADEAIISIRDSAIP